MLQLVYPYLWILYVSWRSTSASTLFIRTSKVLIRLNVFFVFFEGVQPQNVLIVFLFLTFVPGPMVPVNCKNYKITPDERATAGDYVRQKFSLS